jgi:two-component system, NarL family, sensor histidine kinase UhpB
MREPLLTVPESRMTHELWRDTAMVIAVTVLSVIASAHFNLNETLYALTRRVERFQIDELPIGVAVLLAGLVWLSWRRYQQARRELRARRAAEARLAGAIEANRQLAQENLRIQELERKRLARELHDELGQYLNAIKLDAVSIVDADGVETAAAGGAARAIIASVDHVHRVVSDMIARLRPVGLDELGLVAAIEHCIEEWRQRLPGTRFDLSVHGNLEGLGENLDLTLYRLIQEGLTNVYKHANARRVQVVLERLGGALRDGAGALHVSVADDGCGMDPGARGRGFGLSGMRERVETAGGRLVLSSSEGAGLRLEAHLPAVTPAPAGARP